MALGFDAVCTGHYASVIEVDGRPELHRAAEDAKDQSYVLGVLDEQQLRHCLFPLAPTPSKALVREEAQRRGLSVAAKPDSHDICFIPDGDTRGWLAERVEMRPGAIVDDDGRQLEATHTDASGGYELAVPPSPCLLVCAAPEHAPLARRAAPGRVDVELEPRPAPVVGT